MLHTSDMPKVKDPPLIIQSSSVCEHSLKQERERSLYLLYKILTMLHFKVLKMGFSEKNVPIVQIEEVLTIPRAHEIGDLVSDTFENIIVVDGNNRIYTLKQKPEEDK